MAIADPNAETIITHHEHIFEISDPLLGKYALTKGEGTTNSMLADILQTPLARRALDITQLSKAEEHVTIGGTDRFHRLGHVVGLAEMIQRFGRKIGSSPEDIRAYVLSAAFSDLAHGPFSHATDIAVQGYGSDEDFHEMRVPEAFDLGGLNGVFEKYGLDVNERGEIEGITIPDWVESKKPEVCVDRLQYALNEMLLWFDGSLTPEAAEIRERLRQIATLEDIDIDEDGKMVFRDIEQAQLLGKGFLLLSTEHWNEPVNRVQLYLLIESLKYSILNRRLPDMDEIDNGVARKPEEYLYATDSAVLKAMESEPGKTDAYLYAIEGQLADIGHEQQRRFAQFTRPIFERFLTDPRAEEYPSPILHRNLGNFGLASSRFELEKLKKAPPIPSTVRHPQVPLLTSDDNGELQYTLHPLKNRQIDPRVRVGTGNEPLSQVDKRFAALSKEHQDIQKSAFKVHVSTTRDYKEELWRQANFVSRRFDAAQRSKRLKKLDRDPKRRMIEAAADSAEEMGKARGHYRDAR